MGNPALLAECSEIINELLALAPREGDNHDARVMARAVAVLDRLHHLAPPIKAQLCTRQRTRVSAAPPIQSGDPHGWGPIMAKAAVARRYA
jgi:hypothetical protein